MKVKLNQEIKEYCSILKLKGIRAHFEETMSEATCVYRNIRTAIPETSGHETGGIRTLCRLT